MSQHFPEDSSERFSYNENHHYSSSGSETDHNGERQETMYASGGCVGIALVPTNEYAAPFPQPIIDYNHALLPQQVAQTDGNLGPAQERYDSGLQYPCQINPWHDVVFNDRQLGGLTPDAGFYDASLNFPYNGIDTELAFPMAPVRGSDNVQDLMQSNMSFMDGAQPIPASYPTMISAPPAPIAPTAAPANRIRCPHGCPATFGRGGEYRRHMRIHEPPRFRCPMIGCPKTFSRSDKLRDHAKRGHGGVNPLRLS